MTVGDPLPGLTAPARGFSSNPVAPERRRFLPSRRPPLASRDHTRVDGTSKRSRAGPVDRWVTWCQHSGRRLADERIDGDAVFESFRHSRTTPDDFGGRYLRRSATGGQ